MPSLKVAVGDGFFVPDRVTGGFVFGRVMAETPLGGYLVELHSRRYDTTDVFDPADPGPTLVDPFIQSFRFTTVERWAVLRNVMPADPDEPGRRGIRFAVTDPTGVWGLPIDDLDDPAFAGLPRAEVWFPERTERRVAGDPGVS